MVDKPQPVRKNRAGWMVHKHIKKDVRPGSAKHKTYHCKKQFGASCLIDIGEYSENDHHKTDCCDYNIRCRRIVCKMNMFHSMSPVFIIYKNKNCAFITCRNPE